MNKEPELLKEILTRDFKAMDYNNNGEVDREEFKRYFVEKYKIWGEESDNLVGNFDDYDEDHDGKLSYEEYLKYGKMAVLDYEREFC